MGGASNSMIFVRFLTYNLGWLQISKEQEQVLYGSSTSVPEINVSFASSLLHV
jgi:hypothetical protein